MMRVLSPLGVAICMVTALFFGYIVGYNLGFNDCQDQVLKTLDQVVEEK